MLSNELEGSKTNSFRVHVTEEMICSYLGALGINTVKRQEESEKIIAPPTLPIIFWQFADTYWLNPSYQSIIHGEQIFDYEKPILAGEIYTCSITLKKIYYKEGKSGFLQLLDHELSGKNDRNEFRALSTLMIRQNKEVNENE
ncbi:FAS1-like dehydratase domain-containing protein [Bacillus taeanensis]|uniref:FAS1-like dehydratase domain-containing protein n=1 Tax=Bacillus taeanensis TaxID=273032 RepID=A0A366Y0J8_9BACI|nr:MaoC family dehydratase N-terminal domain-containing protein [Bacillus taeanensis]RBW70885.1 hypothetical protein DS031_02475 [Bacillus taeanensis]